MIFPPACLFPTTTVLLDDEEDFLLSLEKRLDQKQTVVKSFTNQRSLKEFLCSWQEEKQWKAEWFVVANSENRYENIAIEIQFPKILETVFSANRFNEITTIVVDYQMPGVDGLQFLKDISGFNVKKVLLTGVANADLAIEAMECGLIDSYVKKNDINMATKLQSIILKHRLSYFENMSSIIKSSLNILSRKSDNTIKNYCQLIEHIKIKYNMIEYYLIDQNGSYMFFDELGNKVDLVIKSKEQLDDDIETIHDQISDTQLLAKLKRYELMMPTNKFNSKKFIKTIPLDDSKHFFYAIDKNIFNIIAQQIKPYRSYAQ